MLFKKATLSIVSKLTIVLITPNVTMWYVDLKSVLIHGHKACKDVILMTCLKRQVSPFKSMNSITKHFCLGKPNMQAVQYYINTKWSISCTE